MNKRDMTTETGWAILGDSGLFVGWHPVRREMIAQHLGDLYDTPRFTLSGKLSQTQINLWQKRKAKGERAVKVRLTYNRA